MSVSPMLSSDVPVALFDPFLEAQLLHPVFDEPPPSPSPSPSLSPSPSPSSPVAVSSDSPSASPTRNNIRLSIYPTVTHHDYPLVTAFPFLSAAPTVVALPYGAVSVTADAASGTIDAAIVIDAPLSDHCQNAQYSLDIFRLRVFRSDSDGGGNGDGNSDEADVAPMTMTYRHAHLPSETICAGELHRGVNEVARECLLYIESAAEADGAVNAFVVEWRIERRFYRIVHRVIVLTRAPRHDDRQVIIVEKR